MSSTNAANPGKRTTVIRISPAGAALMKPPRESFTALPHGVVLMLVPTDCQPQTTDGALTRFRPRQPWPGGNVVDSADVRPRRGTQGGVYVRGTHVHFALGWIRTAPTGRIIVHCPSFMHHHARPEPHYADRHCITVNGRAHHDAGVTLIQPGVSGMSPTNAATPGTYDGDSHQPRRGGPNATAA